MGIVRARFRTPRLRGVRWPAPTRTAMLVLIDLDHFKKI
jgi:GGDEF domain-containing protein